MAMLKLQQEQYVLLKAQADLEVLASGLAAK